MIRRVMVRSDGAELSVTVTGDAGPWVVLVHGYPDSSEVWDGVVEHLSGAHRVVTYDVRGAGRSTVTDGRFTRDVLAADLEAICEAVAPGERVHLVGHDWGSVQSWWSVLHGDAPVISYTSISGPHLEVYGAWFRSRLRSARTAPKALLTGASSWYIGLLLVPGLAEKAWAGPLGSAWPGLLRKREHVAGQPQRTVRGDGAVGAQLYRQNIPRALASSVPVPVTPVPVLLVVPLRDRYVKPAVHADLERTAPHLTRVVVDEGHWLPRTRPAWLAGQVAAFVAAHPG